MNLTLGVLLKLQAAGDWGTAAYAGQYELVGDVWSGALLTNED